MEQIFAFILTSFLLILVNLSYAERLAIRDVGKLILASFQKRPEVRMLANTVRVFTGLDQSLVHDSVSDKENENEQKQRGAR